jgi:hypothetical protein
MTSRAVITTLALTVAIVCSGCMEDAPASDTVSTSTSVESLHPAGMGSTVSGSADSQCSTVCSKLSECGYLEGISMSECLTGCEQGGMDDYLACIVAAADCSEVGACFY